MSGLSLVREWPFFCIFCELINLQKAFFQESGSRKNGRLFTVSVQLYSVLGESIPADLHPRAGSRGDAGQPIFDVEGIGKQGGFVNSKTRHGDIRLSFAILHDSRQPTIRFKKLS